MEEIEIEKVDNFALNGAKIGTINIPVDIDKGAMEEFIKTINKDVSDSKLQNDIIIDRLNEIIKLLSKRK